MHEQHRVERPPDVIVREGYGGCQELERVVASDGNLAQNGAKGLGREVLLPLVLRVEPENQRPWKHLSARLTEFPHFLMAAREVLVAVESSRVIRLARRNLRENDAELRKK